MQKHNKPHIRLVTSQEMVTVTAPSVSQPVQLRLVGKEIPAASSQHVETFHNKIGKKPVQLSLCLDDDPYIALLVNVKGVSIHTFIAFLGELKPEWIVDVRTAARLDVLCGSRGHAFNVFRDFGVEYVDLFGQMGISTYNSNDAKPTCWCNKLAEVVPNLSKRSGRILFLFDHQTLLNDSQAVLSSVLRRIFGRPTPLSIKELNSNNSTPNPCHEMML